MLGGAGIDVEVDENFNTKKHGGRGRDVRRNKKWVVVLIERGSGLCYAKVVRRRDAATLVPLILRHVRPGTRVITDEWRSYRALGRYPMFRHRAVNHSVNFVDPNDPEVNTQLAENLNGRWKKAVRRKHGISDRRYKLHISEFMWRQRFGQRNRCFFNLISHIADLYPCRP